MQRIEQTILSNLLYSEEYLRKVYPFLKAEYFPDKIDNKLFKTIASFIDDYNTNPSKEAIEITLQNDRGVDEDLYEGCTDQLAELEPSETEFDWIVDQSEEFCKKQSVYNAVTRSISILDGKDKEFQSDAIPTILQQALSVAFNTEIGHDFLEDTQSRYEFYNNIDERIPFKLDMFNKISKGGVTKKSLSCYLTQTGGGKSAIMSDHAAYLLQLGYSVLYITFEMAEERIAERIDANILDIDIDDLKHIPEKIFIDRLSKVKDATKGKLIIKEYAPASFHCGHIKTLLSELKTKKKFVPDIIFVDYINLMVSQRFKSGSGANSYTIIKSVAEELRGLAVENNLPIITATQTTRCLVPETIVKTVFGDVPLSSINVGDSLLSEHGYNKVQEVICGEEEIYEIETSSGKTIRCSANHMFPTFGNNILIKTINTGLTIGDVVKVFS